ncbi:hypothetical protein ACEPPN_001606 [Leptodophora sp. 'Broadleaf-Isolate-01']
MRSHATQNQSVEDSHPPDPESNGKMTKGSTEEDGPAPQYQHPSSADAPEKLPVVQKEEGKVLQTAAVFALHAIQ